MLEQAAPNTDSNNLVTWSNDLSLGIDEVDDQHLYLVERINLLWKALLQHREREVVLEIIEDLYSYTQTHFIAEEVLMRSFDYPNLAAHQQSHRKFVEHIREAADAYNEGKPISMDLLHFLNDWLQKHIKVTDRDYANYIDHKKHGRFLGGFKSLFKMFNAMAKGESHQDDHYPGHPGLQGLDMQHAIAVHMEWLKRLEGHLAGKEKLMDPQQAVHSDRCLLGNWITANGERGMKELEEFRKLERDHTAFHHSAATVLMEHADGNHQAAEGLLKTELRQLSNTIRFDIIQLYGAYHRRFTG